MRGKLRTRVFKIAQERGMSDRQLAEAMGIDRTLVWRVRKGERGINQAFITGARRAFPSWGLDDLFYTESEEKAAS